MAQIPRLYFHTLILFSLFILPAASLAQTQIYHWVDAKGVQHYSDTQLHNDKQAVGRNFSSQQSRSGNQVNFAKTTPTQVEVPLAVLLDPEEKEDFLRRGISLEQKILVLFDDTY